MDIEGNRFMDFVSIHQLRKRERYEDFYIFNLSVGPVSIKGLTYTQSSGSIRFPKCLMNGYEVRPVHAFGTFVNELRVRLDQAISRLDSEGSTEEEYELVDMEV